MRAGLGLAVEPMTDYVEGSKGRFPQFRTSAGWEEFSSSLNTGCCIRPYVVVTTLRRSYRGRPIDTKEAGL